MPSWLRTRNFGISSTTGGTAIIARIPANSVRRPPKRSRASAYPASESKKMRPRVATTVMSTELPSHSGKCVPLKIRTKLAVVNGCGIGDSGLAAASGSVLKVFASWMTNGYRKISPKRTSTAYPRTRRLMWTSVPA